jgi:hypothetical protein
MPGVFRPSTFADVVGQLQDGIDSATSASSTAQGTGHFTEADETLGLIDAATVTGQANPVWGAGTWGAFNWG